MDEKIGFDFDSDEVAILATGILRKAFIDANDGAMPDLVLSMPENIDDPTQYSDTLITLMHGVTSAIKQIFHTAYPNEGILSFKMPNKEMKRIVWSVFAALKMTPLEDIDGDQHEGFTLPPHYGEGGNIDMMHARTFTSVRQERQAEYNTIKQRIDELLYDRASLLEEFFDTKTRQERGDASRNIEKCSRELDLLRRDFVYFCEKYSFKNILIPLAKEELGEHDKAVHWNDICHQEELLESFAPSSGEIVLFPYMPKNFQQHEWYLFQFTFDSIEEIDAMGCDPELVLGQDKRRMEERKYERKMLIGYHAQFELMLAKRGRSGFNTRDISTIKQSLCDLRKEIEECARKLANMVITPNEKTTEEGEVGTHDIGEVGTLAATADNILKKAHLHGGDPEVLEIIGHIGLVLHQCFSGVARTRVDDDLADREKDEIIDRYRHDAIGKLHAIQKKLRTIQVHNEELNRADSIVVEALQQLS